MDAKKGIKNKEAGEYVNTKFPCLMTFGLGLMIKEQFQFHFLFFFWKRRRSNCYFARILCRNNFQICKLRLMSEFKDLKSFLCKVLWNIKIFRERYQYTPQLSMDTTETHEACESF